MCLRSGRILGEMVNPKNTFRAQNDAPNPEPIVTTKLGAIGTTNLVGVIDLLPPVAT